MATTHGLSKTRLHSIWRKMKDRCNNPNASNYANYGWRDITVCDEWNSDFMVFFIWANENGYCDNLSLERIDVNGNYNPSNCKWINKSAQSRNKRSTVYADINGIQKPLIEWAELNGICYKTIHTRWYRGLRGYELIEPLKSRIN
ncbi:hypothetical protein ACIFOT_23955 [Neobacillus sp. NRS-1170]|uniref:hypothetical protein n=1 Tax=Neobacillus sp. NRS-1170 TaxID=3233898 RepID=UPI003D2E5AF1